MQGSDAIVIIAHVEGTSYRPKELLARWFFTPLKPPTKLKHRNGGPACYSLPLLLIRFGPASDRPCPAMFWSQGPFKLISKGTAIAGRGSGADKAKKTKRRQRHQQSGCWHYL